MSGNNLDYDVVVVGGGMVGAMLAAALGHTNLSVAVLEVAAPCPFDPAAPHDLRVSALSMASERMLRAVGAWTSIENWRACPYRHMLVWDGEQGGKTRFYSGDVGQTHLGHIVENRVLQLSLLERLAAFTNIDLLCPATLDSLTVDSSGVRLGLSDTHSQGRYQSRYLRARLVVGADGARSKVRTLAGIQCETFAYPQHALVATIETCLPQQATTWQRFLPTGPQAFLPLSGNNASMVWYHNEVEISRLKALPDEVFIEEMVAAFPTELGDIKALTNRGSFPLHRSHAKAYVNPRIALVGDAAHTVHPLAGQGVNLGLLDAAVLAEVIVDATSERVDVGSITRLRRYERWRRFENSLMIKSLDGFYRAFNPQPVMLQRLRSLALDATDCWAPIKNRVTSHAMGLSGDLPRLARGNLP